MAVDGNDAIRVACELATKEGIFAGISSGAALAAAIKIARRSPVGTNIVCMLPDTGERYQSTPLFDHVSVDMNDVEIELSNSTASCRFAAVDVDDPADSLAKGSRQELRKIQVPAAEPVDEEIEKFVEDLTSSKSVVLFALAWWRVLLVRAQVSRCYRRSFYEHRSRFCGVPNTRPRARGFEESCRHGRVKPPFPRSSSMENTLAAATNSSKHTRRGQFRERFGLVFTSKRSRKSTPSSFYRNGNTPELRSPEVHREWAKPTRHRPLARRESRGGRD